jgi:alpha/beta superfamily hydrolase
MMRSEDPVVFNSSGLRLEGMLAAPDGAERASVICHPHPQYGGDMDNNVVVAVAMALRDSGVATLRFNFRGVCGSEGTHGNMVGETDDAQAAVAFLREATGLPSAALVGYSFGAAVGLRAGYDHPGVDCLVGIAPPVSMFDIGFLSQREGPLLFIAGTADPFCPAGELERQMDDLHIRAELICISGADHFFFGYEHRLGEACTRFVRNTSPQPALS